MCSIHTNTLYRDCKLFLFLFENREAGSLGYVINRELSPNFMRHVIIRYEMPEGFICECMYPMHDDKRTPLHNWFLGHPDC